MKHLIDFTRQFLLYKTRNIFPHKVKNSSQKFAKPLQTAFCLL